MVINFTATLLYRPCRGSLDRGFGRCIVFKKSATSVKRYPNGAFDKTAGPAAPEQFPGGEEDQRYKKQQYLDADGICQVRVGYSGVEWGAVWCVYGK